MRYLPLALTSCITLGLIHGVSAGTAGTPAKSFRGFYINGGLGAVFSNTNTSTTSNSNSVLYAPTTIGTSLFTLPDINWRNQFKNGYDFNIALGQYFMPNWHSDLEFVYQNIQRNSYGTYGWLEQYSTTGATYAQQRNNLISRVTKRTDIYSFLTNVSYDFTYTEKWSPFLGVGVGIAWLKSGSVQTNNIINIDDPATPIFETAPALQNSPSLYGTAFAWQIKAGINYAVSETTTAIIQYRLFQTTGFKSSASTIITNPGVPGQTVFYTGQDDIRGILTQAVELNLRFNFV